MLEIFLSELATGFSLAFHNDSIKNDLLYSCCKRCKVLGKKQNDMEDVSFGGYSGQPVAKSIQGSHRSLKAKGFEAKGFETVPFLDDTDDSVTAYGAVSPAPVAAEDAQFDGLKDVEDLTLEEYFQGDSHQLTRHVILILFLCFFSILVSCFPIKC